jgi:hypothetical protein
LALAGCSGMDITQPDYDHLPGSGNSAPSGPGLFSNSENDGYVIYSSNPAKKSLLGPKEPKNKPASHNEPAGNGKPAQQSAGHTASQTATSTQVSQSASSESEQKQFREFQEFQAYQHYKQFQNAPDNAKDRKQFQEWKQWQQYKQWKNTHGGQ